MKFEVVQEKPKKEEGTIVMWLQNGPNGGVTLCANTKTNIGPGHFDLALISEHGIKLHTGISSKFGIALEGDGKLRLIS